MKPPRPVVSQKLSPYQIAFPLQWPSSNLLCRSRLSALILVSIFTLSGVCAAQSNPQDSPPAPLHRDCSAHDWRQCLDDIVKDQGYIWTSPLRLRTHDLEWLAPIGAATGAALHFDQDALQAVGSTHKFGTYGSNIGSPAVLAGTAVGFYGLGAWTHNERLRDTGITGAEAIADALLLSQGLKFTTARLRPLQDKDTDGDFWPHGARVDSSMPSGHATVSWAFAKVISSEYPNKRWLGVLAYAGAATISVSRVLERRHFPSDVLVGGTLGYLTGAYVSRRRLGDADHKRVSLFPEFDPGSRSYGLTLRFTPGQMP